MLFFQLVSILAFTDPTKVHGPTGLATTTTEVLVTYTTVCPVTETITEPGNSKYSNNS